MSNDSPAAAEGEPVFAKPAAFELRMALLFSAQFAPNAIAVAYFPLWLKDLAFSPEQIAFVLAAPLFLRVPASALISAYADRARDRVPVLVAVAFGSAALSAGFFFSTGYGAVLALALLLALVWGPQTPLVDSLALSGVRRFGSNYNLMRGTGSVAFLSANVAGGYIVAAAGPQIVPALLAGGFAVFTVLALAAPRLGRPRKQAILPGQALGEASMLKDKGFVLFVVAGAVIMSSHAHFYTFGSIYWRSSASART
ncbi:MAG: MFS transporter [Phyllobacteriaceae bacterium]|nr:MFS transporter [Phyllobacteriaceae bacterium]